MGITVVFILLAVPTMSISLAFHTGNLYRKLHARSEAILKYVGR